VRNKLYLSLGFVVLYCLTLALPVGKAQAERSNVKQTWEYKVVIASMPYGTAPLQTAELIQRELNQYGADGWELILVNHQFNTLFLKRPK
jgi:Domain of unknown function (DUF4177)